jgi:hypothetical protein
MSLGIINQIFRILLVSRFATVRIHKVLASPALYYGNDKNLWERTDILMQLEDYCIYSFGP